MLTCEEGRRGENFIKWVIPVTLKHVTDVARIQTRTASPVKSMCTRFLQAFFSTENVMPTGILWCTLFFSPFKI